MADDNTFGPWTEEKLNAFEEYMKSFLTATKEAPNRVYLDLFAGTAENKLRNHLDYTFDGSTVRALGAEARPDNSGVGFTHLRFVEMDHNISEQLKSDLKNFFPNDDRYEVIQGNCNHKIKEILKELSEIKEHPYMDLAKAPTLAYIDPYKLNIKWETIKTIAEFKDRRYSKVEMLILFKVPDIYRIGSSRRSPDRIEASKQITDFFGSEAWKAIESKSDRHDKKNNFISENLHLVENQSNFFDEKISEVHFEPNNDYLNSDQERSLYVMLFRYFLEQILGYEFTVGIPVDWKLGPKYVLIFATDSEAGKRIMDSIILKQFIPNLENRMKFEKALDRKTRAEKKGAQQFEFSDEKDFFMVNDVENPNIDRFYSLESLVDAPILPDWLQKEI